METELKQCPFCGGKAKLTEGTFSHYALCEKCSSTGPRSESEIVAAKKWNERAKRETFDGAKLVYKDGSVKTEPFICGQDGGTFERKCESGCDCSKCETVNRDFCSCENKTIREESDEELFSICPQLEFENGKHICKAQDKEARLCGSCDMENECDCPLKWEEVPVQKKIVEECEALRELLISKNSNYGNSALTSPPFANVTTREALMVRLGDKFNRLQTLSKGEPDKVGESINDTIRDIAGYCVLILIEGKE